MVKWILNKYLNKCIEHWELKANLTEKRLRKTTDSVKIEILVEQYHNCIRRKGILADIAESLI